MSMSLREGVAYEYLDDGGVLACYLPDGEYWQLGPPVGAVWEGIVKGCSFDEAAQVLADAVGASVDEGCRGLEALCESLAVMNLLRPGWR